ncbi:MAG: hypothetical protein HYT75_01535 [Deltaproteobacteria bacterium]|nr:hypothetical protein [Deltaproteobacteria bacterium]
MAIHEVRHSLPVYRPPQNGVSEPQGIPATAMETDVVAEARDRLARILSGHESHVPRPFTSPLPEETAPELIARYRRTPEHLLTPHTRTLIELGKLRDFFLRLALNPCEFAVRQKEILEAAKSAGKHILEVLDRYTMGNSRPEFAVRSVVDEIFKQRRLQDEARREGRAFDSQIRVNVVVFDLHMRDINALDKSMALGDWAVPASHEQLKEAIAQSDAAFRIFGGPVPYVHLPQETSSVLISPNGKKTEALKELLHDELRNYQAEMRLALKKAQKEGLVSAAINADSVPFGITAYVETLDVSDADTSSRAALNEGVTKKLRRAVSTAAYLKHNRPESKRALLHRGSTYLYDQTVVPTRNQAYRAWVEKLRGSVPFGRSIFIDGNGEIDAELRAQYQTALVTDTTGAITRRPSANGGGHLQRFFHIVELLAARPELAAQRQELLDNLKTTITRLFDVTIHAGEEARRNNQWWRLMKSVKSPDGDYFLEEVGMWRNMLGWNPDNIFLIVAEGDNAGKYAADYTSKGTSDDNFQLISERIFKTAEGFYPRIRMIIVKREGDQWSIAVFADSEDTATAFAVAYQKIFHEAPFSEQPFEVIDENGNTHQKTLTMSVAGAQFPDIMTPKGVAEYRAKARELFKAVEDAKHANGWRKEGSDWLAFSGLDTFDLQKLIGSERFPLEIKRTAPFVNLIPEPKNKDDLFEKFLPISLPEVGRWDGEGIAFEPEALAPLPPPKPLTTPAKPAVKMPPSLETSPYAPLVEGAFAESLVLSSAGAIETSAGQLFLKMTPAASLASIGGPFFPVIYNGIIGSCIKPPRNFTPAGILLNGAKQSEAVTKEMLRSMYEQGRLSDCKRNPAGECRGIYSELELSL